MKLTPNASLDFLNVSIAGMRDGVGPLLAVFLIQNAALNPSSLSWVMAAPGLASLFLQLPIGFLYDHITDRRRLLALGGVCMMVAAFSISRVPGFLGLLAAQALVGFTMSLLNGGIPALSLQLLGGKAFGARLARNEVFSKIGNFAALGFTGYMAQRLGLHWMFFVVYGFASLVITASLFVPSPKSEQIANAVIAEEVKQEVARATPMPDESSRRRSIQSPAFLRLAGLTTLYFFANSAMLFIFEQRFVPLHPNGGAGYISTAVAITQAVIFFGTILLARKKDLGDPVRILGIGFSLMLLRALIFAADGGLVSLGIGQFLDGLIAAVVLIVPVRAVAALDEKNFNVLSGIMGTCCALGASASTVSAGYMIQAIGHTGTFLVFGGAAGVGIMVSILATAFLPLANGLPKADKVGIFASK